MDGTGRTEGCGETGKLIDEGTGGKSSAGSAVWMGIGHDRHRIDRVVPERHAAGPGGLPGGGAERRGTRKLVRLERSAKDARIRIARLTEAGQSMVDAVARLWSSANWQVNGYLEHVQFELMDASRAAGTRLRNMIHDLYLERLPPDWDC